MERNTTSSQNGVESNGCSANQSICRCNTCGGEFKTPLSAMLSSDSRFEEYTACPKCLSKVCNFEQPQNPEVDEVVEKGTLNIKIEKGVEESVVCPHNFGYLKQRPKNTPIPEDCLICSKMIDCMSQ